MTVEIIIASVIAFSIAFFLMEITMKLVDVTDNEYVSTNFMTDKALVMTNVKKYVKEYLDELKSNNDSIMHFECQQKDQQKECDFESNDGSVLHLGIDNNNTLILTKEKANLYSKTLDNGIKINSLTGGNKGNYIYFQIKCTNIFSDEDYNINIVIYNG